MRWSKLKRISIILLLSSVLVEAQTMIKKPYTVETTYKKYIEKYPDIDYPKPLNRSSLQVTKNLVYNQHRPELTMDVYRPKSKSDCLQLF